MAAAYQDRSLKTSGACEAIQKRRVMRRSHDHDEEFFAINNMLKKDV
jgi:hypothetical protein